MKRIILLCLGLLVSLSSFGCSSSNKIKEHMLEDYQFSASKDYTQAIIRLTMNKDNTYELNYKTKNYSSNTEPDIEINDKWELILSFTYKWTYNNATFPDLKVTVKSDVGIFKLNNFYNNNELQNYLVLDSNSYYLWSTGEEVTKVYLFGLRKDGYNGIYKEGRIGFFGTELYPRGYAMAEWKKWICYIKFNLIINWQSKF